MEANELRIGNLVYVTDNLTNLIFKEITPINIHNLMHLTGWDKSPIDIEFEPIPITEEWLLKFGFVKEENNIDVCYQIEIKDGYFLEYFKSMTYTSLMLREVNNVVGDSLFYLPNIPTFVHSLQNLYFALTGKELEINMTADEILKKHEDANEMHFHEIDRKWIILAMEEYARVNL